MFLDPLPTQTHIYINNKIKLKKIKKVMFLANQW